MEGFADAYQQYEQARAGGLDSGECSALVSRFEKVSGQVESGLPEAGVSTQGQEKKAALHSARASGGRTRTSSAPVGKIRQRGGNHERKPRRVADCGRRRREDRRPDSLGGR